MEGRWFKYKNVVMNLGNVNSFEASKFTKDCVAYAQGREMQISKNKRWQLRVDHFFLDAFESKEDALQVAESIVKGKYDLK